MGKGTGGAGCDEGARARGGSERPERYFTRFQLAMATARGFDLVKLASPDDFALYARGHARNPFGTPLAARGSEASLRALLAELGVA